jgi:hypothetical protein
MRLCDAVTCSSSQIKSCYFFIPALRTTSVLAETGESIMVWRAEVSENHVLCVGAEVPVEARVRRGPWGESRRCQREIVPMAALNEVMIRAT